MQKKKRGNYVLGLLFVRVLFGWLFWGQKSLYDELKTSHNALQAEYEAYQSLVIADKNQTFDEQLAGISDWFVELDEASQKVVTDALVPEESNQLNRESV